MGQQRNYECTGLFEIANDLRTSRGECTKCSYFWHSRGDYFTYVFTGLHQGLSQTRTYIGKKGRVLHKEILVI